MTVTRDDVILIKNLLCAERL